MVTKSERITILGSPDFKAFLNKEAAKERISVSELVRRRCQVQTPDNGDEVLLAELVAELNDSVATAEKSLDKGIRDANRVLRDLKTRRAKAAPLKVEAAG